MRSLSELISFSKDQAAYHAKKAAEQHLKPYQLRKHREASEGLGQIAALLEALPADLDPGKQPETPAALFELDPFHLGNIPDELVAELKISKADTADAQVLELFRIAQRPLNIREILIGLYRKFGITQKRNAVASRLYRLTQSNQLIALEGERGVYKLPEKTEPA